MLSALVFAVVLCGVSSSATEDEGQKFLRAVKALEKRHSEGTYHEEHYPVVLPQEYPPYLARYGEPEVHNHQRVLQHQFLDQKVYPGVVDGYGKEEVVQSPVVFAYGKPLLKYPFPSSVQSKSKGHNKGEPCFEGHLPQYHQDFFYPGGFKHGLEKPIWHRGQDLTGEVPQFYQDSAIQFAGPIVQDKVEHQPLSHVVGAGELPDGRKFQVLLVEGESLPDHREPEKKKVEKKVSQKEPVPKEGPKEENPEKRKSDTATPEKEINQESTEATNDGEKTEAPSSLVDDIDPRSNDTGEDSNIQKKSVDAVAKEDKEGVEQVEVFTPGQPGDDKTEKQASE